MLVEHTFVTVLDGDVALNRARLALEQWQFKVEPADKGLSAVRDRDDATGGVCPYDFPQRVRIRFDRGRVELAVHHEALPKTPASYLELGLRIARIIEKAMCGSEDVTEAIRGEVSHEQETCREFRRRRRRNKIIVVVALLLIVGSLAVGIMSGRR